MELKIEYVPIDSIKPYSKNAKLHPAEQIEQIKKSIQEFGFKDAIAVWNNEVVEGHGRLLAAKELGMKELPIVRLDDLTDEQRRAYALVHNKLTMNSPFDDGILTEELDNILDINMSMFDLGEVFEPEPNLTELDDETTKENIILTINIQNVDDFETLKEEIEKLIEGKNITMAVKMS
jgi:ParB-like chromosome segregation protein Spo0J